MNEAERDSAPQPRRSFGEDLRRERELRQITLREVAEATKINLRFLEALENNDFDVLPGGFFVRGFIKSYARHIGVNEEAMVNAYLMEMSQQKSRASVPPAPAAAPSAATSAAAAAPPAEMPAPRPSAPARPRGGAGPRAVTVGASLLAFFGLAFLLWNGVRQMGQGAAQAPAPAPPVEPASASAGSPPAAAAPADPLPESLRMDLHLRERAWIRILCDGRELVNRTLDAGSRRSLECRDEISLSASDAGALEVEINGRPLPLPGSAGERLTPLVLRRQDWPGLDASGAAGEPR